MRSFRFLLLFAIGLLLSGIPVHAQQSGRVSVCGSATPGPYATSTFVDPLGNLCTVIGPLPYSGEATMAVTNASITLTAGNVTLSPNSAVFPSGALPTGTLFVKLQGTSTANVTICRNGGSATATNCEIMQPGESKTISLFGFSVHAPSFFCASASACTVDIQW